MIFDKNVDFFLKYDTIDIIYRDTSIGGRQWNVFLSSKSAELP